MSCWKAFCLLLIAFFALSVGPSSAHAFFWEPSKVRTDEDIKAAGKNFDTTRTYKSKRKFRIQKFKRQTKLTAHARTSRWKIDRLVRLTPLPPVRPFEFPGITEISAEVLSDGRLEAQLASGDSALGRTIAEPWAASTRTNATGPHTNNCNIPKSEKRRRIARSISAVLEEELDNVAIVVSAAREFSVPIELALAVAFHESRIDSCAISHTGVRGVMQVTKRTASWLGYDRNDNRQNIKAGVKLLERIVARCGAANYRCIATQYNGSTRKERTQWAAGVHVAHRSFKSTVSEAIETGSRILAGAASLGKWLFDDHERGDLRTLEPQTS